MPIPLGYRGHRRELRYAAFVTPFGTYIPKKMMFGLVCAPYYFCKLMAQVLEGLEQFALPYIDDIAIFSQGWKDHVKHIDIVLGRLRKAGLKVKPSKCKFAQEEVLFLGHRIGSRSRSPSDLKIKAIADFPRPTTKTQAGKTGRKGGKENEKKKEKSSEKTRAGRFRKRRGESQSFLIRDADQESKTRMRNNALRTGRRQAVEYLAKKSVVAAVAEWYRYRTVACFVTSSSPVPLKTRRVGQRCTLNLSRAETSSRWCGVVVRRGGASSGVVHVT
ncbi:hypothetical protein TNCV_4654751 [Trichonephila clavipes]|nr:hypothetical protein TNCV_4654751 [Trichonephila clavipes]